MIHNPFQRVFPSFVALCLTIANSDAQSIEKIVQKSPRQVAVTASASGRSVLQWTFDNRPDSIWNFVGESRLSHKGRVSFLAPRHPGLTPRFRVLDRQPERPGDSLFDPRRIRVLKMEITKADMKRMRANLPESPTGNDGGGVFGPGGGINGGDGGVAIPGTVNDGGGGVPVEPVPGESPSDPGDPGDFSSEPIPNGPGPDGPMSQVPEHAYVPAIVSFDGGRKARIGIRIKGNFSLYSAVFENRTNFPFKIDLNLYKSGQSIDGIQKLNLHPVVSTKPLSGAPGEPIVSSPGTYGLEEYLSYGAFRSFGVAASRTGWMDVYLNGEYLGLYTMVENTDSAFMKRNFGVVGGAVYKPENEGLAWKGGDYSDYPSLNWKGGGDGRHESILRFLDVINHHSLKSFPDVVDVQSVFNYVAGNVALGNMDNYQLASHNYLLFEVLGGRFQMLPWDLNLSQADDSGSTLYGNLVPLVPGAGEVEASPGVLTNRIFKNRENDARYRATLKAFIEGAGSERALNARIDQAVALLGPRLDAEAIKVLRGNIKVRLEKIRSQMRDKGWMKD